MDKKIDKDLEKVNGGAGSNEPTNCPKSRVNSFCSGCSHFIPGSPTSTHCEKGYF